MRLAALALVGAVAGAQAMEFRIAGNELHALGKVEGYELALLKDALAEHPAIDTVVFRQSPGGDAWTAYRVGETIRDRGLRTVVAGPCRSACTIMFLGGRERHFAQAIRPEFVYLAFHGTWNSNLIERDQPAMRGHVELRDWMVSRTGGRMNAALIDRFLGARVRESMLYVYDARQLTQEDGVSLFFCEGLERKGVQPFQGCERIAGHNAYSLGLVDSLERVRVTPFQSLSAPFRPMSAAYRWPGRDD